jgi:hypothetical protein
MFRFLCLLCLLLAGCAPETHIYPVPRPWEVETPVCNLPLSMRQQNWSGKLGQGSCVYASLINHVSWLNMPEFARLIRTTRGDGEYDTRLRQWLDSQNVEYTFTNKASVKFLDFCSRERIGCILWWKPSHCCTFEGWVKDSNGTQYAVILDNNYISRFEYVEKSQFLSLWAGYGGFGLAVLDSPAIAIPYRSYEER